MPNLLANRQDECSYCPWQYLPDNLLLHIFSHLTPRCLLNSSETCHHWHQVAVDEFLWKAIFFHWWKVEPRCQHLAPRKTSWLSEFKRLYYHTPLIQCEVLRKHRDQVLHVSFSHDGKLFSTCSKDGYIKVWNVNHPTSLQYYADMREFTWKYTQFSQFNHNDTLLLVSGVHFGAHSTSGEIAVFNLVGGFELQCRVLNKPYDIFGTWYNENYLLSGNLHWMGSLTSCSVLWLNKAYQALESEQESVVMRLFKFHNVNASSMRTIMIANCHDTVSLPDECVTDTASDTDSAASTSHSRKTCSYCLQSSNHSSHLSDVCGCLTEQCSVRYADALRHVRFDDAGASNTQQYSQECVDAVWDFDTENPCLCVDTQDETASSDSRVQFRDSLGNSGGVDYNSGDNIDQDVYCDSCSDTRPGSHESKFMDPSNTNAKETRSTDEVASGDKYLIFTTGMKTYTPHQIGVKRIRSLEAERKMNMPRNTLNELPNPSMTPPQFHLLPDIAENQGALNQDEEFDSVDHLIELHGHIIGMCLTPDHRYLYVNCRAWPQGYHIDNPLNPPPIAQEIDIHVIDLWQMCKVETILHAHKAYTPNDECFFIFLDASDEYVASGAEDKFGYMWDRHYGVFLTKFQHADVVNSVAFNPQDPEMLITVSDDHSIKIWRSRHQMAQLNVEVESTDVKTTEASIFLND